MPEELTAQISRIAASLKNVLQQHQQLSEECTELRNENQNLKEEKQQLTARLRQAEDQALLLKSSIAPLDEKERAEFEKRISEYLRTIEKCIAMLKT